MLRLILPGFACASKFTSPFSEPQCHGSQVPLAWCGGLWQGRGVVPVIGALFQSRGWLPIVEAPGYSRHPTSILAMQLLNIENHTLSFQTYEFSPYSLKHWSSHLILLNIRILTSSCQTLEFETFPYKHWNSHLIGTNIGTFVLSFQTLEF